MGIAIFFAACNKVDDLPSYGTGNAPTLSASTSSVAATAADSSTQVISFSWTNPQHATDPATYKYVLQFDVSGNDFKNAAERIVIGTLGDSLTGKQLNDILLGFGFAFNVAYNVDIRVISSYGNNNEQLISNVITLNATPYRIPPKIDPPTSGHLYLVGNATAGGWNNPVPVPTQEFSRIDETTYAGVFDLSGGNQYLALPVNGDWSNKFAVANGSLPGLSDGGDFGFNLSDNFPGPATSGTYLIIFDFQIGKFKVLPYTGPQLPTDLFMVGDATPGGWNNPVPVPSQQLTRLNSCQWEITTPLDGNKHYLLLPVNGSWDHKYAVPDNTLPGLGNGGLFGYDASNDFPSPSAAGTYKVEVNFAIGAVDADGDPDIYNPVANRGWFKTTLQ
ncbi:MAG: SusE domain-containing protein [Ferruginibacter sp.]